MSAETPPTVAAAPSRRATTALWLSALAVPLLWVGFDLITRRGLIPLLSLQLRFTYAGGVVLGLLFWGAVMEAARHPHRGIRFTAVGFAAFTAAFGIGGQTYYRGLTYGYVNRDALMLAVGVPGVVAGYAGAHVLKMAAFFLTPAVVVAALALYRAKSFGPREERPGAFALGAAAVTLVGMFAPIQAHWYQAMPPDMLWLNGSGGPLLYAAGLAAAPPTLPAGARPALPAASPVDPGAPPIIVLFGESVRADEVCSVRAPGCELSPRLDAAAPDRIGYPRARSISSCTEVVSSVLWTGLPVTADRRTLASAPLLWDYAKARGYRTAYLASQHLLFQSLGLFLGTSRIDVLREARDRDVNSHMDLGTPDEVTTAEALDFLQKPGPPPFLMIHFANTHSPYRQAPGFTPYPTTGVPVVEASRNVYRNSVFFNDHVIGDFLAELRKTEAGRRAVVISLSDHGEAWGMHRSFAHTWDLYGEQIDIPLWIDAPPGSLPDETLERLRREAPRRSVTTPDVAATIVDLLGVLDEPSLREHTARLAGASLLRDEPASRDVLLWNCPPTRQCPMDSLGVLRWPRKLHYVGREAHYACFDVSVDPHEDIELPPPVCADLHAVLDATFGPRMDLQARQKGP